MFDLKTDNQLKTTVAAIASGAILLTGAAGVAAAEVTQTNDPRGLTETERRTLQQHIKREVELTKKRAERQRQRKRANRSAQSTTVEGVPRSTLDAIAACESGGDPTAVNPAGYYGKYQFSLPTWQAVGGKGNPAEATEAEQDLRAAILYNQSGPGQWPVCGA